MALAHPRSFFFCWKDLNDFLSAAKEVAAELGWERGGKKETPFFPAFIHGLKLWQTGGFCCLRTLPALDLP